MSDLPTTPEFAARLMTERNLSKTAAANEITTITGQSVRSTWKQLAGEAKTPKPISRLLAAFTDPDIPESSKKRIFDDYFVDKEK